jgi:hypothetical protein
LRAFLQSLKALRLACFHQFPYIAFGHSHCSCGRSRRVVRGRGVGYVYALSKKINLSLTNLL